MTKNKISRAEFRRQQRDFNKLPLAVRAAGLEHMKIRSRDFFWFKSFVRHYVVNRRLGLPRLQAARIAWTWVNV